MLFAWPVDGGVARQIISIMPHFHSEVGPAHLNLRAHMVIYPLTPPGTVCTSSLSFAILVFLLLLWCESQRQIAAVVVDIFWGVRISEALEHSVNIFDLINTEMWEMINAFLSCSHSFPDVSIITSYHFNMAIWHSNGNCPSVTVHLSPFLNIRI